jgi:hypothetical protein
MEAAYQPEGTIVWRHGRRVNGFDKSVETLTASV